MGDVNRRAKGEAIFRGIGFDHGTALKLVKLLVV